jgi:hypothetical protein
MKSLLGKLGVVLIGVLIFGYAEVWGEDWKVFASGVYGLCYYDAESITRPSKNIVRVWEKIVYSEKGVIKAVKELGERYKTASYSLDLSEIDCIEKKRNTLMLVFYAKGGSVISTEQLSETEWSFIIPGSMEEILYKAVCK